MVAWPSWSTFTLMVTGTPKSGPGSERACSLRSAAAASASASVVRSTTIAFSLGLSLRMRSTTEVMTSEHENRRSRIPAATSTASNCHNSARQSTSLYDLSGTGRNPGLKSETWATHPRG